MNAAAVNAAAANKSPGRSTGKPALLKMGHLQAVSLFDID
jgi:hypothetical protein